jgi:hypothetical protein
MTQANFYLSLPQGFYPSLIAANVSKIAANSPSVRQTAQGRCNMQGKPWRRKRGRPCGACMRTARSGCRRSPYSASAQHRSAGCRTRGRPAGRTPRRGEPGRRVVGSARRDRSPAQRGPPGRASWRRRREGDRMIRQAREARLHTVQPPILFRDDTLPAHPQEARSPDLADLERGVGRFGRIRPLPGRYRSRPLNLPFVRGVRP